MSNLFSGISSKSQIHGPSSPAGAPTAKSPTTPNADDSPPKTPTADAHSPATAAPKDSLPESSPGEQSTSGAAPGFDLPRPLPAWLNPAYAKHIVKGNYMTLSVRPRSVEHGEWVAHQVVEHYRNLWNFVRVLHEKEEDGTMICNLTTCPKMSAGEKHTYTWLNRNHEPVELPASEYMILMQRWMSAKIDDYSLFPTDAFSVSYALQPEITINASARSSGSRGWLGARSGFPKQFSSTCQLIFRQIFRVYAHMYWDHYIEPFYHINLEKQLNSCFSHFILTATALDMLQPGELEPMQLLVDLWAADGTFPPDSRAFACANLERGKFILSLGAAS